jgi:predicted oxidoreductase
MQKTQLGNSTLKVSRLAYGCWRIAGTWDRSHVKPPGRAGGIQALINAHESGFTFFDLADIYCDGVSEEIFGEARRKIKGLRRSAVVSTKCGIRPPNTPNPGSPYRYDFSADYIIRSCDASLQRLGMDCIDVYQLHRPDYLMEPAEVAKAFTKLKKAGKVKHFGVSNFRPAQITLLQSALKQPLLVNQVEISLSQLAPLEDGILDQCMAEKMTPMAWSPLGGGHLGDGAKQVLPSQEGYRAGKIRRALDKLARDFGVSRGAVALAWLLRHPAGIIPIIGSIRPAHIKELALADTIKLTREQWYTLYTAARKTDLP